MDADDIADVAVAALTEDRHVGELYELTGPRLADVRRGGRRDRRRRPAGRSGTCPISIEEFAAAAADAGRARPRSSSCSRYLFGEVLDGRNAHLADGVQRALGREPRDFSDYARDAAASGVWDPSDHPAATAA